MNYYVAFDDEQHLRYYDNSTFKSIFLYQAVPGSFDWQQWLQIDQDVSADFQQLFGSSGQSLFQTDQSGVTICLQLMGFGGLSTWQVMLWDDLAVIASVPAQTIFTTTSAETTSASFSIITSTATSSTTQSATAATQPSQQLLSLGGLDPLVAIGAIAIVCLVLVGLRLSSKRRPAQAQIKYCINCGASLRRGAKFCGKCGAFQES